MLEVPGRGTGNTGTVNYLVEHRHRYTDTTPNEFGIANLGYAGFTGIPYANDSWHLTNLYWLQSWDEGRVEVGAGFLDITDFVDVWALTSPWTDFFNFVFSIGAGTMDLPDDQLSVEAYYRWQITPQVAVTPDVQLLVDPALNPDESTIWVFGLRARIAF